MQTSSSTTTNNNYTSSSSSSSSSPSPSHSSSITHHSAIASSTASSSSSFFPPPPPSRCIGLNLLVKAIHQVTAGSIIGVPYIQHRIVTRRKRPVHFNNLIITSSASKPKPKPKRQSGIPWKYKDSVLQPLTPKRRSERTSSSLHIITNGE